MYVTQAKLWQRERIPRAGNEGIEIRNVRSELCCREQMRPHGAELHGAELQVLRAELARADAGRRRLRAALADQREEQREEREELERQLLLSQRQLRQLEGADGSGLGGTGGGASTEWVESLRGDIQHLHDQQRHATERELEAQSAMLQQAHVFHITQQRLNDRLQTDLASQQRDFRLLSSQNKALRAELQEISSQSRQQQAAARAAAVVTPGADGTGSGLLVGVSSFLSGSASSSKADQLTALQASFRDVVEELSRQEEANASLQAELRTLRDAPRSTTSATISSALPAAKYAGASMPLEGDSAPLAAEAASPSSSTAMAAAAAAAAMEEEERERLAEVARGFEDASRSLAEAAAQRREVQRGVSDLLWQLRRRNPDEPLEPQPAAAELQAAAVAAERQAAAEVALRQAAVEHASALAEAKDAARSHKQRAFAAEVAVRSLQRRLDAGTSKGEAAVRAAREDGDGGGDDDTGGGGGKVGGAAARRLEEDLRQAELAMEAAVSDAAEGRELREQMVLRHRQELACAEERAVAAELQAEALAEAHQEQRERGEAAVHHSQAQHAALVSRTGLQLASATQSELKLRGQLADAEQALALRMPAARCAALALGAACARAPLEAGRKRAAQRRLALLVSRARAADREAGWREASRVLLARGAAAVLSGGSAGVLLQQRLDAVERAAEDAESARAAAKAEAEAARDTCAAAQESAQAARETLAAEVRRREDAEAELTALQTDARTLLAAGEGAEALREQLLTLRGESDAGMKAVQAELALEVARGAASREEMREEVDRERESLRAESAAVLEEAAAGRAAAEALAAEARERLTAALAAAAAAAAEAEAERAALTERAEAAAAAAERASGALFAEREASSLLANERDAAERDAQAVTARANAAAEAAAEAVASRGAGTASELAAARERASTLEGKLLEMEAELHAERLVQTQFGGATRDPGGGPPLPPPPTALLKSIQAERDSLHEQLSALGAEAEAERLSLRSLEATAERERELAGAALKDAQLRVAELTRRLELGPGRAAPSEGADELVALRARVQTAEAALADEISASKRAAARAAAESAAAKREEDGHREALAASEREAARRLELLSAEHERRLVDAEATAQQLVNEAQGREAAQADLVRRLQARQGQAAGAAAAASKQRGGAGENGALLAALAHAQARAENLAAELAAASEARLQASSSQQRLGATLAAERQRGAAREAELGRKVEERTQALQAERTAAAAVRREASTAMELLREEFRGARRDGEVKEAEASAARTEKWAAQRLAQEETARARGLEDQLTAAEKQLVEARDAARRKGAIDWRRRGGGDPAVQGDGGLAAASRNEQQHRDGATGPRAVKRPSLPGRAAKAHVAAAPAREAPRSGAPGAASEQAWFPRLSRLLAAGAGRRAAPPLELARARAARQSRLAAPSLESSLLVGRGRGHRESDDDSDETSSDDDGDAEDEDSEANLDRPIRHWRDSFREPRSSAGPRVGPASFGLARLRDLLSGRIAGATARAKMPAVAY